MFSSPVPPIEINCAEVLAIYRAIQISSHCDSLKNQAIVVESDSSNAVMWYNADSGGPWNLCFQLNFIRSARKGGQILEIIHKGRATNDVADTLAKQGLRRDAEFLAWL